MINQFPHDPIVPFRGSEKEKKEQVAEMFDRIAPSYDQVNRVLSVRVDIGWRKKAIRILQKDKPLYLLDVATGTGDMAILAAKMIKPDRIEGIDISQKMLDFGIKKIEKEGLNHIIHLQKGDSETINFPDNSFDAIMVAFGVRNFADLNKGLREMLRVLKPGGRLMVLEFSKPRRRAIKGLYNLYMGIVTPQVAKWFKQNKEAYHYLHESSNAFPDRQLFTDILKKVGYTETGFQPLTFGICCIYTGKKSL